MSFLPGKTQERSNFVDYKFCNIKNDSVLDIE